ncbi:MAG: adenylyl-sulfate kinase [Planctomycetes bacterium]|nr:adenylyl-sulfate kinase [Planctomycetota bacterium]
MTPPLMTDDDPGAVVWITGLSGAGKTTLARAVTARLRGGGQPAVMIDGDDLRKLHRRDLSHSPADRLENARRIGRLAQFLSAQRVNVVVATISLFHEVHEWNREHLERYLEVYLHASIDFLERRDPKGLYRRAREGLISEVAGVDLAFEEPLRPDLRFDSEKELEPEVLVDRVLNELLRYEVKTV